MLVAITLLYVAIALADRPVAPKRATGGGSHGTLDTPSTYQSPRFRYWWPGGWIQPDQVVDEVKALAAAGFGGAEIADVRDSIDVPMDTALYGWAQPNWNAGILAAYTTGNDLGLHIDYTVGPQWPTGVPGYTPDSPQTSKELVHGSVVVKPGQAYIGSLPKPTSKPSGVSTANPVVNTTAELVAVLAAQTTATSVGTSTITFTPSSLVDLTSLAQNGTLNWTAPDTSSYILVAIYSRGTGQIQSQFDGNPIAPQLTDPYPAYIVDHFSTAGVQASVDYWNAHILTDTLEAEMNQTQGSLFEDSLELVFTQYWTPNFLAEFQTRRGYDLTPYLLYVLRDTNKFSGNATIAVQVQADFYKTVSDLYIDYRLKGLQAFANSLQLKMRAQPYYIQVDSSRAAAVLDLPEGESLGFKNTPDGFRILAAGRDIAGKTTILSCELGAQANAAYTLRWKDLLGLMNKVFAYGVSQSVIHGYPYRDSPDSHWPGYSAFTPRLEGTTIGYSEPWGTRQPQWLFAPQTSGYMARSQLVKQAGSASTDVAVLNTVLDVATYWADSGLNNAGYTYQFPSLDLLASYNSTVENGRLALDGPAYKALVLNNLTAINPDGASLLQSYSRAGLPIVIVGNAPNTTQSLSSLYSDPDSSISTIFSEILSLNTTLQVANQSLAPAALSALGVMPSTIYQGSAAGVFTSDRRNMGDGSYMYWLYASTSGTYTISLEGEGWPLVLNRWTGDVIPLGSFQAANGYVSFNLTIAGGAAEAIYVGNSNPYGAQTPSEHVTSTAAEAVVNNSSQLLLRSTVNGTYGAVLSTGNTSTVTFSSIPPAVTVKAWSLTVEDWSPTYPNSTGLYSSQTNKTTIGPLSLSSLVAWSSIPDLAQVAGIGVYKANVTLAGLGSSPANVTTGVYMSVGTNGGPWGIKINGKTLQSPDWFSSRPADISDYVVNGINELEFTITTTMVNKLRTTWPSIFGSAPTETSGLVGPFLLTYFHEVAL